MAKSKRTWITLALIAAASYGGYRLVGGSVGADAADDFVANQLWISELPKNDRAIIKHLVLLDQDGGRWGIWGASSTWKHDLEIFKWAREKDRLSTFFPQTRRRAKGKIRAWKCEGEAPKPFELCLEVVLHGNKRLYYSREEWVIEPGDVAESLEEIAEGTDQLEPVLDRIEEVAQARADQGDS